MDGTAWRDASATSCSRRPLKNGSAPTRSAPAGPSMREAKAASISVSVLVLEDRELHSLRSCRLLHVVNDTLGTRAVRVHQQGDPPSLRNQLRQQLKPLSRHLAGEHEDPSEVAARPGEAGDQPVSDRVAATPENDR